MIGAFVVTFCIVLVFAAMSIHYRALKLRHTADTALRVARAHRTSGERYYREARRIHAHCRPSPFEVRRAIFGRVSRGVS